MSKKYTWNINNDDEIWGNGVFDTEGECIKDYLKNYAGESPQESIFIGKVVPFIVSVDGGSVIDQLEENAMDECGECSEGWEPSCGKTIDDWNELDKKLTDVIIDWLKKHNDMPTFYKITDVGEVSVK